MSSSPSIAKFQLDGETITQLLSAPEFYTRCVAFSFLRDQGLRWTKELHDAIRLRGTPHFPAEHFEQQARAQLKVIRGSFVHHVARLHDMGGPSLLAPLREYLVGRLGYEPEQIVLEYQEKGERTELFF